LVITNIFEGDIRYVGYDWEERQPNNYKIHLKL